MPKGFKKSAGSYDTGHDHERQPKKNGAPQTGFDNGSHGKIADKGAGPGIGANGKRIK